MKALRIEGAIDTPFIHFDPQTRIFNISGISHPENAKEFYIIVLNWLDEFYEENKGQNSNKVIVDMNFKYINSSSYKYLREMMKRISNIRNNGINVEVIWNYHEDDEDLLNEGIVLMELPEINLPYRCIPYT